MSKPEAITRSKAAMYLDEIGMCATELNALDTRKLVLLQKIQAARAALHEGLLGEMAPDFEIQPQIHRSGLSVAS